MSKKPEHVEESEEQQRENANDPSSSTFVQPEPGAEAAGPPSPIPPVPTRT
jgi:hypothetical protein